MLFITILLLIITVILLRILWILHNNLDGSRQLLQSIASEASDINKNIECIRFDIKNIEFPQNSLEEYDINKAIETLENIEKGLLDINKKMLESVDADSSLALKDIRNTLHLLEHSLDIITAHPAFTKHDDDSL